MKAPVPLPFVRKGEDVPPTGVTMQAVLGFILPFILILATAVIAYFIIRAGVSGGEELEEGLTSLPLLLGL